MAKKVPRKPDTARVAENVAAMQRQLRRAEKSGDRDLVTAIRQDIARMRAWARAGCPGLDAPPRTPAPRRFVPEAEPGRTVFYVLPDEKTWPGAEIAARQGAAFMAGAARGGAAFRGASAANRQRAAAADAELLPRFVDLIRSGEVTKSAAAKLEIGIERAKRLRSLAVRRGDLAARRRS